MSRAPQPIHHPEGLLPARAYFERLCECGCGLPGAWPCKLCRMNCLGSANHHPRHQSRAFDLDVSAPRVERDTGWAVSPS